jgi:hypothetical protein
MKVINGGELIYVREPAAARQQIRQQMRRIPRPMMTYVTMTQTRMSVLSAFQYWPLSSSEQFMVLSKRTIWA